MTHNERFEATVQDHTLWEGYEKWLSDQYEDDLDTRADYLTHLWAQE